MARKTARTLSTIEMTVLGYAWLRGPCTTYAIMKELSLSGSTFYKSRAGTAYSVSNRLLTQGLLEHVEGSDNLVRLTPEGLTALQDWVRPPVPMGDIAHSADLIRLRFFFLGVLNVDERVVFIDDALASLRSRLVEAESLISANQKIGEYLGAVATVSLILETRARIQWLEAARDWVIDPLPDGADWSAAILGRIDGLPGKT